MPKEPVIKEVQLDDIINKFVFLAIILAVVLGAASAQTASTPSSRAQTVMTSGSPGSIRAGHILVRFKGTPAQDVLDQPVQEIAALGPVLPFHFPAVHPNLPGADAIVPSGPQLFAGGFHFPFVDFSVPVPHLCKDGEDPTDKHCHKHRRHPPAPEPATWLLLASGLVAVGWQYQRTARKSRLGQAHQ